MSLPRDSTALYFPSRFFPPDDADNKIFRRSIVLVVKVGSLNSRRASSRYEAIKYTAVTASDVFLQPAYDGALV
jgi:hypothetical protein